MKITKSYLKRIILQEMKDSSQAPSIINNGGQLMELEEYLDLLESKGMPRNAAIYLEKIGNLAHMTPDEEKKLRMPVSDWKKKNDAVIKREASKAKKLAPQAQKTEQPEKKGKFGLGFLGLEENKRGNEMKITKSALKQIIKEELEEMSVMPQGPVDPEVVLGPGDPMVMANRIVDMALQALDRGDREEAARLLAQASKALAG